jgi:hypothetical protein
MSPISSLIFSLSISGIIVFQSMHVTELLISDTQVLHEYCRLTSLG